MHPPLRPAARLYGRALNTSAVGVSCGADGAFFSKAARGFLQPERPWMLSVQDPLDAGNDTARGSYNIKMVRQVRRASVPAQQRLRKQAPRCERPPAVFAGVCMSACCSRSRLLPVHCALNETSHTASQTAAPKRPAAAPCSRTGV